MQRFVLPGLFATTMLIADLQSPPALSDRAGAAPRPPSSGLVVQARSLLVADNVEQQRVRDAQDHRAADLQRQVNDLQGLVAQVKQQLELRKTRGPAPDVGGQQGEHNAAEPGPADQQQQDAELHRELQSLIAQLDQELQLEVQSPPAPDAVEQQQRLAARESLKNSIADLRQQDAELQGLVAQYEQQVPKQQTQAPPDADASEKQAARDALEHQVVDLQRQVADLRRQDDALQGQIAEHRQELAQRTEELARSTHDIEAARAEADKLRQDINALQQQRQKAQEHRAIVAEVTRPAASAPTPPPTQPIPPRQQTQPAPTAQPMQPMPAASASQQLQTAQQWLSAGRPDDARRLLAMVQTQVVFQPGTPEQPDADGRESTVTDVGDAIRWLDMGAGGKAMQSIKRAIDHATGHK